MRACACMIMYVFWKKGSMTETETWIANFGSSRFSLIVSRLPNGGMFFASNCGSRGTMAPGWCIFPASLRIPWFVYQLGRIKNKKKRTQQLSGRVFGCFFWLPAMPKELLRCLPRPVLRKRGLKRSRISSSVLKVETLGPGPMMIMTSFVESKRTDSDIVINHIKSPWFRFDHPIAHDWYPFNQFQP